MGKHIHVLLVEDDEEDAAYTRRCLERAQPGRFRIERVAVAADVGKAVARLPPDLILLDLSLPDTIGMATFRAVRHVAPEVTIIALTGIDDEGFGVGLIEAGAEDFVPKSESDSRRLVRSLLFALARRRHRALAA